MNQTFSFEFEHKRHFECGRLYYVETNGPSSRCPYCAWKREAEDQEDRTKRGAETARLGRVIAGLRGALKRAKVNP